MASRKPSAYRRRPVDIGSEGYYLVHSDQLYRLEPVDGDPRCNPQGVAMGPLADPEPAPAPEPSLEPAPGYGPEAGRPAGPSGFFLDRYVY